MDHGHVPVPRPPPAVRQAPAAPAQHSRFDLESASDLLALSTLDVRQGSAVPRTLPHSVADVERQLRQSPTGPDSPDSNDRRFTVAHAVNDKLPLPQQTTPKAPEYHVRFKGQQPQQQEMSKDASLAPAKDFDGETELRAGVVQKPFKVSTRRLMAACPCFAKMGDPGFDQKDLPGTAFVSPDEEDMPEEQDDEHHDRRAIFQPPPEQTEFSPSGPFYFPDMDEFSFELFAQYIQNGSLPGPTDFHSMNHYLTLYIIAQRFQVEKLENEAMDCIRAYYRQRNMTAPAFRLDYVYRNTDGPCLMREFLVNTAAFRALTEVEPVSGKSVSTSIQNVLRKGHEFAADYAVALATLSKNGIPDAREGSGCKWHIHHTTPRCK